MSIVESKKKSEKEKKKERKMYFTLSARKKEG